jgi:glyoxylase-like metal-dependent hydrolase (beta-lactamase superfamily II)
LRENSLIIDFLNVGFGESIFVRTTGVKPLNILVDGGDNRHEMFAGIPNRIKLSEYLRREAIKDIDLMILTHFHRDHIAGVSLVATAHGGSLEEVARRPALKCLFEGDMFERAVILSQAHGPGTIEAILDVGTGKNMISGPLR